MTEITEERVERAVPAVRPQPYMPPPLLRVVLIGAMLVAAVSAHAQQPPAAEAEKGRPSVLSLEWEPLAPDEPSAASSETVANPQGQGSNRVYLYTGQVLSSLFLGGSGMSSEEQYPVVPVALTAKLRDDNGAPLAYQAVGFALESSFGTLLQFGKVPTDGEGRARLVLRDRRCGIYPFQVTYGGNQAFQRSYAQAEVDFGPCPAPALPAGGVLITPYATAPITLASIVFFGTTWGVFFYVFGYLFCWRLRRAEEGGDDLRLPGGSGN